MCAWIKSHQTLATHHKTLTLADCLGVSVPTAIGHLHLLWWWCLDNARDGNINAIKALQIKTVVQWDGDPQTLVNGLLKAKFIEKRGRGGICLHIHNWEDYGGELLRARAAHVARTLRARGELEKSRVEKSRVEKILPPIVPQGGRGDSRRRSRHSQTLASTPREVSLAGKYKDKVQR
jgi:hypothetical protein